MEENNEVKEEENKGEIKKKVKNKKEEHRGETERKRRCLSNNINMEWSTDSPT